MRYSFSMLNVDYVQLNNKWNYKNVISPYYRIYYVDGGEGTLSNANQSLKLTPHHLYIIPSYTLCHLNCEKHLSVYFVHFFEESNNGISLFQHNRILLSAKATDIDIANFKRLYKINPNRGLNRSDNPKVYEKEIFYKEYEDLNNLQRPSTFMETQGIILQLISRFVGLNSFQQKTPEVIPSKILGVMSYININLKENISVTSLASIANQNRDYFSRLFHKYTGSRPIDYLHDRRIERAQYLILRTTLSFEEIAHETGFESIPHFFRIFKRKTSLTPDQFRKMNIST